MQVATRINDIIALAHQEAMAAAARPLDPAPAEPSQHPAPPLKNNEDEKLNPAESSSILRP